MSDPAWPSPEVRPCSLCGRPIRICRRADGSKIVMDEEAAVVLEVRDPETGGSFLFQDGAGGIGRTAWALHANVCRGLDRGKATL